MGIRLHLTKQIRLNCVVYRNRTVLVHGTGYVKVPCCIPRLRSRLRQEKKQSTSWLERAKHWNQRAKKDLRFVSPLILRGWHRPIGWRREAAQSTR